jgi:hypothetical protein
MIAPISSLFSLPRLALPVACLLVAFLGACTSVPKGEGTYLITVKHAESGKPIEGVEIIATGTGGRTRGGEPSKATTDDDGNATIQFGNWGAVDLQLYSNNVTERWMVTQDRVAVNGGKSSVNPLRLIVGAGRSGGVPMYNLAITRVEKGGKVDN